MITKSKEYAGWLYDSIYDDYISPKGRLASYPGAPFTGQVSKTDLVILTKLAEEKEIEEKALQTNEYIEEDMSHNKKVSNVELVKTIKFGDVTINFIRVT